MGGIYHCIQRYSKFLKCGVLLKKQTLSLNYRTLSSHASKTPTKSNVHTNKIKSTLFYVTAGGVLIVGLSYAAVPLYRMFCQSYSYGGTTSQSHNFKEIEQLEITNNRMLKIRFNADISASMRWNFKPQQYEIKVVPGETALAFYTAKNPSDKPIIGISTYNVIPFEAGAYFNKIQCFCFEEQQLNPHEEVDMPVFFYIDPEFSKDPKMENVDTITLSYTFFEAKDHNNFLKNKTLAS